MKRTGKPFAVLMVLVMLASGTPALGAVIAQLDRTQVALGDSVRLTISATDDEELSDIDLRPLERDFDILRRSTNSSIKIINGSRTHEKTLIVDLAPLREGTLQIPRFALGKSASRPLQLAVGPAPDMNSRGNNVLFEAEVDHDTAYVQSQVLLTLRIQRAIELESMSISELEIENAFIKPLETREFYRTIDGRNWRVHEVRYAIFPEQSGTLEVPAQVFSGRATDGRRGFFNRGSGRLLRRSTEPLTITVKPRPAQFDGGTWLPAQQLKIEERWSTPPESLRAGESATRTITLMGEGIQGAQLPPILYSPSDGLKFYPDQPEITEQEVSSGLLGARRDTTAIVPTREGNWTLPEIKIPWWDTRTQQMRYAILPAKTLRVAPADPATITSTANQPGVTVATDSLVNGAPEASAGGNVRLWQALAGIFAFGWLATLLFVWMNRRQSAPAGGTPTENPSERRAFKALQGACQASDAAQARVTLIAWANSIIGAERAPSLEQIAACFKDDELKKEIAILDACLYRDGSTDWDGGRLAQCTKRLRQSQRQNAGGADNELTLYPQPG